MASRCYWIRIHFHEYVYNANEKTLLPRSNRCQGHYLPIAKTLQGEDPSQVEILYTQHKLLRGLANSVPSRERSRQSDAPSLGRDRIRALQQLPARCCVPAARRRTGMKGALHGARENAYARANCAPAAPGLKRFHFTCSLCISVQDGIFLGKEPLDCSDFGV